MTASKYFGFKLLFILLAMINLEYIRRKIFTHPDFVNRNQLPAGGKLAACLAMLLWGAAILCGRITAYPGILGDVFGF
jgi:hypothetical protein